MNKRILASLIIIGLVGIGLGSTTMAMFNDTETSQGNQFTAGELDLRVDWDESYNGEHVETQELTNNPGTIFNFEDLKPGDHGEATISLHLEDNPGWIWMNLNQTSNWDNACTEPEREAEGQCGSEGELDEELEFVIWADDGDNVLQGDENVIFEGTAQELEEQSTTEGLLLDGDTSTNETEPFSGEETGYIGMKWNLPLETGNHIQGDSVSYDVEFYTEQRRHNDNPDNPWDSENDTEVPENEPPVASFERANDEPLSTKVGNEVRFYSTSTDDDEITKSEWSLGDGTTKFGQDVWHSWNEPGNYTVGLEVTDSDGETDSTTKQMEVTTHPDDSEGTVCEEPQNSSMEYTADEIGQAMYGYNFEDLSGETKCEVEDLFNNQPFAEGLELGDLMTKDEISQEKFERDYDELSSESKGEVDESYMNQFADETVEPSGDLMFDDQMISEDGEVTVNNVNTGQDSTVFVTYESENGIVNAGAHNAPADLEDFDPMTIEIEQAGIPGEYAAHIVPKDEVSGYDGSGGIMSNSTLEASIFRDTAQITAQEEDSNESENGSEEETETSDTLSFSDQNVSEEGTVEVNDVTTNQASTVFVTYESEDGLVNAGAHGASNIEDFDGMTIELEGPERSGEYTAHIIPTQNISSAYEPGDLLSESTASASLYSETANITDLESDEPDYIATQGDTTVELEPIEGDETVQEFYDFRLPDRYDNEASRNATNGASFGSGPYYGSAGTEDIQQGDASLMFLYNGPEGLSFVVVHEGEGSNDGGSATFEITDLNGDGEWVVKDDLYLNSDGTIASSNYDRWETESNPQTIDWTWGGGGSDGGAYSTLSEDFEFTIDPSFNNESSLYEDHYNGDVDEWQVISGNRNNPDRTTLEMDEEVTVTAN